MDHKFLFPSAASLLRSESYEPKDTGQHVSCRTDLSNVTSSSTNDDRHVKEVQTSQQNDCQSGYSDYPSFSGNFNISKNQSKRRKKDNKKIKRKGKLNTFGSLSKNKFIKKPDTIWLDNTNLDFYNAFRVDGRSDISYRVFESLCSKDVATYNRHFKWGCLGVGENLCISHYPHLRKRQKPAIKKNRYFMDQMLPLAFNDDSGRNHQSKEIQEFIPLSNRMGNDMNLEKDFGTSHLYVEQQKIFSDILLKHPSDIRTWIEFVDFQDSILSAEENTSWKGVKKTPKALTERKISILDRAMSQNPSSIELILKHSHLIKEVWPSVKVHEKWKEWLFKFPNQNTLWHGYILFMQTDLLTMNVPSVIKVYKNCFLTLLGIYTGSVLTHKPGGNAEEDLLVILLQFLVFLWRAGHTEKAVCIIQCMVEFNLSCPDNLLENSLKQKMEQFEVFFDSAKPRFSEVGAVGWKSNIDGHAFSATISSGLPVFQSTSTFEENLDQLKADKTMSKEYVWAELESIREICDFEPFNGSHEDCEDTDRIVLYDDISFALFNLPSLDNVFQLVLSYLLLSGIPVPKNMFKQKVLTSFESHFLLRSNNNACFCHSLIFNQHIQIDSTMLTICDVFDEKPVKRAREIFSQACHLFSDAHIQQLSQVWFHFETFLLHRQFEVISDRLKIDIHRNMKRFIRHILKLPPNRNCIALWNMYALYLWNIGDHEESNKIYHTALQLCSTMEGDKLLHMAPTIRSMIDVHLVFSNNYEYFHIPNGAKQRILKILGTFSNKNVSELSSPTKPSELLKVCSLLKSEFATLLSREAKLCSEEVDFFCCYIVFEYLFNGFQALVSSCEGILKQSVNLDHQESVVDAIIYALCLMRCCCEDDYSQFSKYKSTLENCFTQYPNENLLNRLFMNVKQHGLDSQHARKFYESILRNTNHIYPWLHAIKYEEKRLQFTWSLPPNKTGSYVFLDARSSIQNRVCSLYQRMLKVERFKYCSDLWMRYIAVILKFGDKKAAKDAFYASLQTCPGDKSVYIFATKHLGVFKEIYGLMREKEIRLKLIPEELDVLLLPDN